MNDAYLVFCDSEIRFLRWLLKCGFGHIWILINDGFNWIWVNPRFGSVDVIILSVRPDINVPQACSDYGLKVLSIRVYEKTRFNPYMFLFCPGVVQYILGFRKFALMPYRLYKRLRRHNNRLYKSVYAHELEG